MATGSHEFDDKICDTCAPKKTVAITSCHGCHRHFCRKHFNEHRDQLSNYLNKHVDLHDEIREDLKTRIDRTSEEQLANDDAKRLLQRIDDWMEETIDKCRRTADEVRDSVKQLFNKTSENDSLTQRLSSLAKEIEEQQQSDQPTEFPIDVMIETQDIDWETSIKIAGQADCNKNLEHYVIVEGKRGTGKTTFIHYVANYFANKHFFHDRLSQTAIDLNKKETIINSLVSERKYMVNEYSFPSDNQTSLVFLDRLNSTTEQNENDFIASSVDFYKINSFAALVVLEDGTDLEMDLDANNFLTNDLPKMAEKLGNMNDQCKHAFSIAANCSRQMLNLDYSTFNIYDNLSFYFMQNSAYQLFRARSLTDSTETDFCTSMKAINKIITKIVQEIHHQTLKKLITNNCIFLYFTSFEQSM